MPQAQAPQGRHGGVSHDVIYTLLKLVRAAQPISRAELARRLSVNRSTVTEISRPLLTAGVLREAAAPQKSFGRTGRPPVGLSLHAEGEFVIGVNIGVRRTSIGAMALDGTPLGEESFPTLSDVEKLLSQVRERVEHLRHTLPDRSLAIISVSVPGPTDAERASLLYAPHLGWRDVPVAERLRMKGGKAGDMNAVRAADVLVVVENEATAAAVYEARRTLRDSTDATGGDFVVVSVNTGVGVGLVFDGEVYRGTGMGGLAGEFGHMTIVADGLQCVCGGKGCWEVYASTTSVAAAYNSDNRRLKLERRPNFKEIVRRADAGDAKALHVLERTGNYLGIGISNVISGIGAERVVVTGRIVYGWKFINPPLCAAIGSTMVGRLARWSVEPGEAAAAGLRGALEVAVEQYLSALVQARSAN